MVKTMEFWIIVLCTAIWILGFPYVRCFIKRLICAGKILNICRKKSLILHKAHILWFLGHKHSKKCDFYVETSDSVYAVKSFGVPRHHHVLLFKTNGDWFIRRHLYILTFIKYAFNGKPKPVPAYNFRYHYKDEWEIKTPRNILLIHPVSMEIRLQPDFGPELIAGTGDIVNGMEIQSLSRLISELERNA